MEKKEIEKLKKAIMVLTDYIDGLRYRTGSFEEQDEFAPIKEEIEEILRA